MKKKAITIILIVAGLLMFTLPVLGSAKNDFPILDKLMKADFGAKKRKLLNSSVTNIPT